MGLPRRFDLRLQVYPHVSRLRNVGFGQRLALPVPAAAGMLPKNLKPAKGRLEGRSVGQVLIVDDSIETCQMMARLVRRFRHEAECVYGGEPALARMAQPPLP